MTVVRLGRHTARRHAVIAERPAAGAPFVEHVGLLHEATELVAGSTCAVLHCSPPLQVAPPGKMIAHLVGELDLTKDELEILEAWLVDVVQQALPKKALDHYILVPPARRELDEVSGKPKHWRFSCAGFVWKAYEHAGLKLVVLDTIAVDRATLLATWGEDRVVFAEKHTAVLRLGLDGPPPWPVLLPAHLLHALERGRTALPIAPTPAHATFA
jgi:hypothetical protein